MAGLTPAVPDRMASVLQSYAAIDDTSGEHIRVVLGKRMFYRSRAALLKEIGGLSSKDAMSTVQELTDFAIGVMLTAAQDGLPLEDYPAILAYASNLDITDIDRSTLESRLEVVFGSPTMRVMAKAYALEAEHLDVLTSSFVVTDLRPVFLTDSDDPAVGEPQGYMVWHSMRLSTARGESSRTICAALDRRDHELLSAQIRRALRKEAAPERGVARSGRGLWESGGTQADE